MRRSSRSWEKPLAYSSISAMTATVLPVSVSLANPDPIPRDVNHQVLEIDAHRRDVYIRK